MAQCQSKVGKIQCDLQEEHSGEHAITDDKGVPLATWLGKGQKRKEGTPWSRR
jgi:hypothetical protein